VFCAFGSLSSLCLLLALSLVNWLLGLGIPGGGGRGKALCALGVVLDLGFLAAFKYLDFLLGFLPLSGFKGLGLPAPLGVSFFTFKCISYLVDTRRDGSAGTRSYFRFLLYISFFPQLAAGPITRFGDLSAQLSDRPRRAEDMAAGLRRFILGLSKKLLLAGAAARLADPAFLPGAAPDARLAWLGAVGYLLQIYLDFSGYSDMAIGLGRCFGFRTPENFNYPYISASVTEFWRRWHISLSLWFRDYLYIPLGGSRRGRVRAAVNKLIVFALCGLWHGAAWTFVLWGLWHGLLSALETLGLLPVKKLGERPWGRVLGRVYTLLAVCLGFVLFRAETLADGARVLGAMFGAGAVTDASTAALYRACSLKDLLLLGAGILISLPLGQIFPRLRESLEGGKLKPIGYLAALLLLVLCFTELAAGGFAPFIYAQF
jgi:alginate O-acetyltransferase complex protein AlgI